jgi:hypothetical protein
VPVQSTPCTVLMTSASVCPSCDSLDVREIPVPVGPHHGCRRCGNCGVFLGWLKQPWSKGRARAFTLRFGKHRGKSIGELADDPETRGYVHWLSGVSGSPGKAARIALEATS